MRVAVAGSSGLIGSALTFALNNRGHEVVRLVRREPNAGEVRWDPTANQLDPSELSGVDAVINLAGRGIAESRWTDQQKSEILHSRVDGNRLLSEAIASLPNGPANLLVGSVHRFLWRHRHGGGR